MKVKREYMKEKRKYASNCLYTQSYKEKLMMWVIMK